MSFSQENFTRIKSKQAIFFFLDAFNKYKEHKNVKQFLLDAFKKHKKQTSE